MPLMAAVADEPGPVPCKGNADDAGVVSNVKTVDVFPSW